MSVAQAREAIEIGIETARGAVAAGATLLGIGEMGIANSTSAAAILAAFTGFGRRVLPGVAPALTTRACARKIEVIERALQLHRAAWKTASPCSRRSVASRSPRWRACAWAARRCVPVVVDGFIATAAAVAAERLSPGIFAHLFFSHRSAEGGHALVLERLGVRRCSTLICGWAKAPAPRSR